MKVFSSARRIISTPEGRCFVQRHIRGGPFVRVDGISMFSHNGHMVHVALAQRNCEPPAAQISVTAYLGATIFAEIPSIDGSLAYAGDQQQSLPPPAYRKGLTAETAVEWNGCRGWRPAIRSIPEDVCGPDGSVHRVLTNLLAPPL